MGLRSSMGPSVTVYTSFISICPKKKSQINIKIGPSRGSLKRHQSSDPVIIATQKVEGVLTAEGGVTSWWGMEGLGSRGQFLGLLECVIIHQMTCPC